MIRKQIKSKQKPKHSRTQSTIFLTQNVKENSSNFLKLSLEGNAESRALHTSLPSPRKGAKILTRQIPEISLDTTRETLRCAKPA
jgi:hypothetical protein